MTSPAGVMISVQDISRTSMGTCGSPPATGPAAAAVVVVPLAAPSSHRSRASIPSSRTFFTNHRQDMLLSPIPSAAR